jgi:KDO2-lipid IV(A) lauroyltransferase
MFSIERLTGHLAVSLLRGVRRIDPDRSASMGASLMRRAGPWLPEHKVGRANLAAAFPEKSADDIEQLLLEVWDGLGRLGAEYAHLERIWDYDPDRPAQGRIEIPGDSVANVTKLKEDGRPGLLFAAHFGNWELSAVALKTLGLDTAIFYRNPNNQVVASALRELREGRMGSLIPAGFRAPALMTAALDRGHHVGMLVDQHFTRGIDVMFFGRRCKANPLVARLAQRYDCPIHGARVVRLPGERFRVEFTDALEPARDASGRIEIAGTMQRIMDVIEGWVREAPEQWLWLHRRWR